MSQRCNRKMLISTVGCLFIFSLLINGQTYRFKNFGADSKLPDTYIYTLSQDNDGFLWIGTGSGLVKFDGNDFYDVIFPDSVINRYAQVSLKDKNGSLWFGCNDGSLFYTRKNELVKIPDLSVQSINCLVESKDGFLYVIPQDKLILKININNPDEISRFYLSHELQMTTACLTSNGNLLLGTQENLFYCSFKKDSLVINKKIEGIDYSKVEAISALREDGKYIVGTDGSGLYKLNLNDGKPVLSRFRNNFQTYGKDTMSIKVWMTVSFHQRVSCHLRDCWTFSADPEYLCCRQNALLR